MKKSLLAALIVLVAVVSTIPASAHERRVKRYYSGNTVTTVETTVTYSQEPRQEAYVMDYVAGNAICVNNYGRKFFCRPIERSQIYYPPPANETVTTTTTTTVERRRYR